MEMSSMLFDIDQNKEDDFSLFLHQHDSELSNRELKIKSYVVGLGGTDIKIRNWFDRVDGIKRGNALINQIFFKRMASDPVLQRAYYKNPNDILHGRITREDGKIGGVLVHISELEF